MPQEVHIPLLYRLFLLYIEPIIFLPGGIYLTLFRQREFILSSVPSPVSDAYRSDNPGGIGTEPITPLIQQLLTNTAALYILFMVNELLVLRFSKDLKVWRAVVLAMLCCDVVHLYGVWVAGGGAEFMLDPVGRWRMEDWVNTLILAAGSVLRTCFLVGLGVKEGDGERGKRE